MDLLHPDGSCICAHEGKCEYCQTHCLFCGAREDHILHQKPICCKPFGPELRTEDTPAGEGIRAMCTREAGHENDCALDEMGPHGFMSVAESAVLDTEILGAAPEEEPLSS